MLRPGEPGTGFGRWSRRRRWRAGGRGGCARNANVSPVSAALQKRGRKPSLDKPAAPGISP
eukprot:353102-Chlamydomonas_euryale.AAC.5